MAIMNGLKKKNRKNLKVGSFNSGKGRRIQERNGECRRQKMYEPTNENQYKR
jgi:hypothetical protein